MHTVITIMELSITLNLITISGFDLETEIYLEKAQCGIHS